MSLPPPGSTPAAWYPDPTGRHELRWYDGNQWTDHVSDQGNSALDPLQPEAPVIIASATPERIADQVSGTGLGGAGLAPTAGGGGTLFDEPVLVVNQKAKVIELTNQYAVYNRAGVQVASVTQVGQSAAKKVLRALTSLDQFMTHRLEVRDMAGTVLLGLTRPAKLIKSTVVVADGQGREVGRIVQENMIGKIHFALEAGGQRVGSIHAENWRAWNFSIRDASEREVARITKTFEGIAKTLFTTADNYVVQLHTDIAQPLLTLVVASALSVDTALKQDAPGTRLMLLAIDVGNTQTLIGLFPDGRAEMVDHWRISTVGHRTSDEYALVIQEFLAFHGFSFDDDVNGFAVSSVVPRVTFALRTMCDKYFGFPALVIEPGVRTGMPIRYDDPKEVGADRIVNAVGAFDLYGGPTIVVDFGTATTVDVVSAKGEFLGGAIVPGIEISLDALFERAAGLRRVELVVPRNVIGRTTAEAIQSGAIWGFSGQIDGICKRFMADLGECTVVATGGLAPLVAPFSEVIAHQEPWLTLHGLRLVFERNKR